VDQTVWEWYKENKKSTDQVCTINMLMPCHGNLSHQQHSAQISEGEFIGSNHITSLLRKDPGSDDTSENTFADVQLLIILYLLEGIL